MATGPISNNINIGSSSRLESFQQQSGDKAQKLVDAAKDGINTLKELSHEMSRGIGKRTEGRAEDTGKENKVPTQLTSENKIAKKDGAQLGEQGGEQAAAFAGSDELERLKKKKEKKKEIQAKLSSLFGIAQELSDVEFEDKEHQKMVDEFLSNMNKIKNFEKRSDELDMLEEKFEKQLAEQQEKEKNLLGRKRKVSSVQIKSQKVKKSVTPIELSFKDLQARKDVIS